MKPMHNLLKRQLKRHFGEKFEVPEKWRDFADAVGDAYRESDVDRGMLERSLELSSQELLQANSDMRGLFQAIPDLMFRLDHEGVILDFKAGATNDFFIDPRKLIGKRIQDFPQKDIGSQFGGAIRRVVKNKSAFSIEYSLMLEKLENFYEARLVPLPENQIVVIIRNITERKKSEAAVQERLKLEEQLSKLVATAPGVIHAYRLRPDGTTCFPYASPSIENIYGLKAEEIARDGTPALNRIHPDDAARLKTTVEKSARAMSLWREEFRVNHPQKGLIWVEGCSSPVREPDGGILWHGFLLDITDRKRAEVELRRTVSLLQSTLESTADGILVVDRAGKIILFNKRFSTIWRIPQSVLDTRNDDAALKHVLGQLKEPDIFLRKVQELYLNSEAESFDVLEFKDGRVFERYSCPQRLDGAAAGRVWSFRDITERKELEAKLRQSQKMDAFGQLAAGVAHDFNNILTVIQGNLALMQTGQLTKDEQVSALDQAMAAAERAAGLTRQLLTFGRRQIMQPVDLDLNEVVANMTKMLQRLIGANITFEARCAPGKAMVHADLGMMEQAVMNLAINSRDAMPKGGRLIIQTAAVGVTEADLKSRPNARTGKFIRISVRDTGCGISAEHLPHIFEPFFTTKEVGRGTGLGLATVFGIIEQHDGWIEVESRQNEGTTVSMLLPSLPGGVERPA